MRATVAVGCAVLAAALAATATSPTRADPASPSSAPVIGVSQHLPGGMLAWFDPLTLRMLPGRKVPLGFHGGSWAFSADRSVLAAGACDDRVHGSIRFVNARAMRLLGGMTVSDSANCVSALAWLRPERLLAVASNWSLGEAEVGVVNPTTRRLVHVTPLPSSVTTVAKTSDELVLLLEKKDAFTAARIAVVDADGHMRTTTVDRVLLGSILEQQEPYYRSRTIVPGFAVDPEGRRAFLVPASGPVAEVDLRTLRVSYHELDRPSLLHRFLRWLTPAAEAKAMEGPVRDARWLGDGLLAVSGADYSLVKNEKDEVLMRMDAAGVRLLDTHSWRTRVLSRSSSNVAVAPGLVIAEGGSWDPMRQRTSSPGIIAFGHDGRQRWTLHPGGDRWLDTAGGALGYGYVWVAAGRMQVVDLASGKPVRTIRRNEQLNPWPWLLAAQSSIP